MSRKRLKSAVITDQILRPSDKLLAFPECDDSKGIQPDINRWHEGSGLKSDIHQGDLMGREVRL